MVKVVIALSDILTYVGIRQRPLKEGESVFKAGHVIFCQLENIQLVKVFALVLQTSSLTSPPHEIHLNLLGETKDWKCVCTCKAGQSGFCKHVVATLIYINRFEDLEILSATDVSQQWGKEKKNLRDLHQAVKITEFCHPERKTHKKKFDSNESINEVNFKILLNASTGSSLQTFKKRAMMKESSVTSSSVHHKDHKLVATSHTTPGTSVALHSTLSTPGTSTSPSHHDIPSGRSCSPVVRSVATDARNRAHFESLLNHIRESKFLAALDLDIYMPTRPCCISILEDLRKFDNMEAFLVDQTSKEWIKMRQLRITGSRCYPLYTYSRGNWYEKAMKYFWPKSWSSAPVRHGKISESYAITAYRRNNPEIAVQQLGFLISDKFPWFGYSPDGIVFENGKPVKLIEVKCPYSGKTDSHVNIASSCDYLEKTTGVLKLKQKHIYYGQVQLGMALLNLTTTDFLVYSTFSDNYLCITVNFDHNFATSLMTTVTEKYFNHLLHVYCGNKNEMN